MSTLRLAVYGEMSVEGVWRTAHRWEYAALLWVSSPCFYADTLYPVSRPSLYAILTGRFPEHMPHDVAPVSGVIKGLPSDVVEETERAITTLPRLEHLCWVHAENILEYPWSTVASEELCLTPAGAKHFDLYGVIPTSDLRLSETLRTERRPNPVSSEDVLGSAWLSNALFAIHDAATEASGPLRIICALHRISH